MKALLRAGALALLAFSAAEPASAQWTFPWLTDEAPRARQRGPAPGTVNRGQAQLQRGVQPRTSSGFWWDDDEDDDARPQNSRGSGSVRGGPALREGGPRPSIAPATPPVVGFGSGHAPGSVVIDTSGRALYYVLDGGRAYRYPIAVGREGFTWTGTEKVSRKAAWPDWHPPAEMRARDPRLPEKMTGGLNNPLGAMAIYLGNSLYRIHGTNDARSIGSASSSGCFRMTNSHVTHLASLVNVGATVHVLRGLPSSVRRNLAAPGPAAAAQRG